MAILKCKMCGGDLALTEGSSTARCEYCGSLQTVPLQDDEKKLIQFERAERLRKQCEFDKAAGIYEAIVADFRQEAEAYWGLVLCKYGIEYVDDPATGKKIPTCHRSSFDSVLEDSDLEQALENADVAARRVYREEAKQIEEIRKGILSVSANEKPYDIFICYKETSETGERTLDSVLAQDVYDALTDKGYRVFFSRISLEDKLGVEFEPYIFAALNSAKIMLVFGTDYEYFNAVWVKNEWSRYLKLMAKDKSKHLIPCYKGIDAYDMPKEFARLQAQDLGKMGAIQDIVRNMDKLISRQTEAPRQTVVAGGLDDNISQLLSKAYAAMEAKDWKTADSLLETVEKSEMSTAERVLVEQSIRQNRDTARYQLRCEETKLRNQGRNRLLTVVTALAVIVGAAFMLQLVNKGYQEMLFFLMFIHLCCTVPFGFIAKKALLFVPRTSESVPLWRILSYAICIIGILVAALLIWGFYPEPDQKNREAVMGGCSWAGTMICLYSTILLTLLTRKKV